LNGIETVLLIQLGDIGDVVLTFPAMKALRDFFPHAEIMLAVRHKAKALIEDCPWVDGVISIDPQKRSLKDEMVYQWRFFSDLRKHHFDLAIDMRTGTRGAILAFLSGASQRVGFYADDGKLWRNRLFTDMANIDYRIGQYVGDYYSSILNYYGIPTHSELPTLPISGLKQNIINNMLKQIDILPNRPFVVIQPFSLWQYKEWKIGNYAALIRQIHSQYRLPMIITGSCGEADRADEIVRQAGVSEVHNFAGKTSLGELAALLKASRLFIGCDSAGIHIAAAVGTPTVGIFGPSSSASWAPKGDRHVVVTHPDFSCIPCRNKGCENSGISRCLDELEIDNVMTAVRWQTERYSA
jgi:heptosyltransferase-3